METYAVKAFNMKWKAFVQELRKDDSELFDLVISEPLPSPSHSFIRQEKLVKRRVIEEIDENEVKDLPTFLKRVLKTCGYCLLFFQLRLFPVRYEAFVRSGFEVVGGLYTKYFTTELRCLSDLLPFFSRVMTEFELIAKLQVNIQQDFGEILTENVN